MQRYDFDGLTSVDGIVRQFLEEHGTILVPPDETVFCKEKNGELLIVFPTFKRNRTTPIPAPFQTLAVSSLLKLGWAWKKNTRNLLDEFLKLVNAPPLKIGEFAANWGPLWYCSVHDNCYFPISHTLEDECLWSGEEKIETWQKEARKVKAVLEIASCLKRGDTASSALLSIVDEDSLWSERLEVIRTIYPVEQQKLIWNGTFQEQEYVSQHLILSALVNTNLNKFGEISINLGTDGAGGFKLAITPQLGFLPAVWMQVAQLIAHNAGIYTCYGCGRLYLRERKAPKGKNNYCPECRKGGKPKLDWWHRNYGSKKVKKRG